MLYSTKAAIQKFILLEQYWLESYQSCSCIRNVVVQKRHESLQYGFISILKLRFLQNNSLDLFVQDFNLKLLYFSWIILFESIGFLPCSEIRMDQKCQSAISHHMLRYSKSYFFSSNCFIFHQVINRKLFTWGWLFASTDHGTRPLHRIWTPDWPKVAKVPLPLRYLDFIQLVLLENCTFEFFYQVLNWRWYSFECFLDGTVYNLVTWCGMFIGWTSEKIQLKFLLCRLSNSKFSEAISLISSDNVFIEMISVKTELFLKIDECLVMFLCATLTESIAVRLRLLVHLAVDFGFGMVLL